VAFRGNIIEVKRKLFTGGGSGAREPRILYVSEAWTHGAQVRYLGVLRALQQIGTVEVATLNTPVRSPELLPNVGDCVASAHSVKTRLQPNTGPISKLRFTLNPRTDYPYGRAVSEGEYSRIGRIFQSFDLIWFFKQRSADMFPNVNWRRSVVDIDDVQSTYEHAALYTGSPLNRLKALRALFIWRRRERLLTQRFDVLTVCSDGDRDYLRAIGVEGPVHVVPNGFDRPSADPVRIPVVPPRIGFIGGFDHLPNSEGMRWFVKNCWRKVRRGVPGVKLRVIGRASDRLPELYAQDIERLGWLADPSDEIRTWHAMIVPIRTGAGTSVKIAQGFSEKCPIVSTSFGARGYGVVDGTQMYLADSAEAFSNACVRAIGEPEEATRMAERAWIEFLEKWTWDAISPRVLAAAEDCLRINLTA
jgi:glycosyltransferase involved in cell wall biosynthesis